MTGIDGAVPPPYSPNDVSTAAGGEPRLDQPYYGIGFVGAVKRFFSKYAVFSGRASRSEYWFATLFLVLASFVIVAVIVAVAIALGTSGNGEAAAGVAGLLGVVLFLAGLAVLVPSISVQVRRLHDGGFSGWLVLLNLVPSIGSLVVLIFSVLPSDPAGARYDEVRN